MNEFKIRISNQLITVNQGVYITYYKMGRRERYLQEVCIKKIHHTTNYWSLIIQ